MPAEDALSSFLARVVRLTEGELLAITAAAERRDRSRERLAMRTAQRAAEDAGLGQRLREVRDAIIAWATDAGPGSGQLSGFPMPETIEGNLRRRAAPELINAAIAIALGDRLRPEAADQLLAAWRSAIGTGKPAARLR